MVQHCKSVKNTNECANSGKHALLSCIARELFPSQSLPGLNFLANPKSMRRSASQGLSGFDCSMMLDGLRSMWQISASTCMCFRVCNTSLVKQQDTWADRAQLPWMSVEHWCSLWAEMFRITYVKHLNGYCQHLFLVLSLGVAAPVHHAVSKS